MLLEGIGGEADEDVESSSLSLSEAPPAHAEPLMRRKLGEADAVSLDRSTWIPSSSSAHNAPGGNPGVHPTWVGGGGHAGLTIDGDYYSRLHTNEAAMAGASRAGLWLDVDLG
jgi:hypothetical protein